MRYPSPTLDGFDTLWNHPIRWFARQFLVYGIVAVTATVVVAAAGIYSLLVPAENVPAPDPKPKANTVPSQKQIS